MLHQIVALTCRRMFYDVLSALAYRGKVSDVVEPASDCTTQAGEFSTLKDG